MKANAVEPERVSSRVRLDRAGIIEAGLELAARPGVSTISVRELGHQLGADPTAIYRHFRSKDTLMAALLDELNARAVSDVRAPVQDWGGRLRDLARATLAWYVRHPAIAIEAMSITTHGTGELAAIELMLDAFHRAGLRDGELVRHYALMATHVLSVSSGIARGHATRDEEDDDSSWLDAPLLADPRTFPLIAANSAALSDLRDEELFLMGVDVIIDSAARTAAP